MEQTGLPCSRVSTRPSALRLPRMTPYTLPRTNNGWINRRASCVGTGTRGRRLVCPKDIGTLGPFEYAGEVAANHIARWDGANWHPLGTGIDGTVVQMATLGDELFVVGAFSSAGSRPAASVAKWSATNWPDLGPERRGLPTAISAAGRYGSVVRT